MHPHTLLIVNLLVYIIIAYIQYYTYRNNGSSLTSYVYRVKNVVIIKYIYVGYIMTFSSNFVTSKSDDTGTKIF